MPPWVCDPLTDPPIPALDRLVLGQSRCDGGEWDIYDMHAIFFSTYVSFSNISLHSPIICSRKFSARRDREGC